MGKTSTKFHPAWLSALRWAAILGCLLLSVGLRAAEPATAPASGALPGWYQTEIDSLSQGSGRWVADNSAFRSEQEPFEQYVVEWRKASDQRGLTGRLFGISGGKESADFWSFRIYWDAAANGAVIQQFAGFGAVGIGSLVGFAGATLSDQSFTAPDGRTWREMHHSWFEGEVHVTRSLEWREGSWSAKRTYRWKLQP